MKESVRAFEWRTGQRYLPPAPLLALGRPLRGACPTLFRYPGPCGMQQVFAEQLDKLGRPGGALLWMADRPLHADVRGAGHFGTLAVLEPLRALPVLTRRRGIYVGLNLPQKQLGPLVWVPPSALQAEIDWDLVRTPQQARARFGRGVGVARARVAERLAAYLAELGAMARAGAPAPAKPWCELSRRTRNAQLACAGVAAAWTGCHDRAPGR